MAERIAEVSTLKTSAAMGEKNWSTLNGWSSSVARAIKGLLSALSVEVVRGRTSVNSTLRGTTVQVVEADQASIALPDPRTNPGARVVVHRLSDNTDLQVISAIGDSFSGTGTFSMTSGQFSQEFISDGTSWIVLGK